MGAHKHHNTFSTVAILLMVVALPVRAQEVGTIAAVDGTAEIERGGAMIPGTTGVGIFQGDVLQTGNPGRMRVVFQDDSVLTLSDDSRMTVDEHVFNPDGQTRSLLQLLRGKVTAVVSEYYRRAGARYEIKTATAVCGVRGTEFSISYDPSKQLTEVVGISGVVSVHSTVDPTGPGVLVRASEATTIAPGELPAAPHKLDESTFRQQLLGRDFMGVSRSESPTSSHPLVAGGNVPPADRAGALLPVGMGAGANAPAPLSMERPDASNLLGQSPAAVKATTGQLDIDVGRR